MSTSLIPQLPPSVKPFHLSDRQLVIRREFGSKKARNNLVYGGARSGKTFLFVRQTCVRAISAPMSRHVILRLRSLHVKQSIWMDTLPKVMRLCWPDYKTIPHEGDGFMQFPNKTIPKEDWSELWCAGLDDKERVEKVLGKEFCTIYFNECSQIPYASILMALTRLAQKVEGLRNQAYYDLNPVLTGHWTYRQFVDLVDPTSRERKPLPDPENYAYAYMNPEDNAANIDPAYLQSLRNMPERQRKRFYEGKYSSEQEGQLWGFDVIERNRRNTIEPEELIALGAQRIIVAVDPSGAKGEFDVKSDEIGLVVVAQLHSGKGLVLEDASGLYSPEQWGRMACFLYHKWSADRVVGEKNFGGDMVRAIIHAADRNVSYKEVTASRGKAVRAEPVAALYEQNRISHCGTFPVLEDEQMNFTTLGYMGAGSPNHADALVWGLTELFGHDVGMGLIEFLKSTEANLQSGAMVMSKKTSLPITKEQNADMAKIATSTMTKPAVADDTACCPACSSLAIVRIGKRMKCNQCGNMFGPEADRVEIPNRAGLFK